ncbi:malate/lactate/ureidoglycolate dehydrogenase [Salinarimonas soli]|uniref:Malate/lactate/ureidoglycolate dehydrogenase n=2 Tax=Salinarimonas soli TaxID=1638099 RepID=A0A5B2W0J0_9HYPH|nr:malate/lactate/ureidoglycolate dehydrogenase [Salinarimonas soli]
MLITEESLLSIAREILLAAGFTARAAELTASHLVVANLMGHDSHGVGMLPAYVRNVLSGDLRLGAALVTVLDEGPLLILDGGHGPGQVMAHDAVATGIERARQTGLCLVGLRDSHHIGRIGHYAEQCAGAGMVSLHFVNVVSSPAVAPFGGDRARLGTNPVAIGIPRQDAEPIVVDFATSRWAVGKVRVAQNEGRPVPPGTLLDAAGRPTTDAGALFADPPGALLPFGEHKGWGLALACELLGAALIGGRVQAGPRTSPAMLNSMLTVIISPERLRTEAAFQAGIAAVVAWATEGGEVRLPGEPERSNLAARRAGGIPIDAATWSQIRESARSVGSSVADAAP